MLIPCGPQAVSPSAPCCDRELPITCLSPWAQRHTHAHMASWLPCGQWLQPRSGDRAFGFLRTCFNGPFSMWGHVPVRGTGRGVVFYLSPQLGQYYNLAALVATGWEARILTSLPSGTAMMAWEAVVPSSEALYSGPLSPQWVAGRGTR